MSLTETRKTAAAWLAIAGAAALLFWLLAAVLMPFAVAAVLAYALHPLVERLHRLGRGYLPRVLAVALVELLFLLALLSLLLLLVPILAKELPLMREQLPLLADRFNRWLTPLLAKYGFRLSLDVVSVKAFVLKYLNANTEDAIASVLSSLKLGGSVALALLGNAILIPVALFYLLMDWSRLVERLLELVPPVWRGPFDHFMADADSVLGQYLHGQLRVMGVLAIYFSVALTLFGFDLALPVGIFTGLAFFIPYLGFGTGLLLALLAALLQFGNAYGVLVVAGIYGLGQVLEGTWLTPRLVGERIGLHPLAVIFALLAFGQLFGLFGVLIALPVSAVLLVAVRRLRTRYLASGLYRRSDIAP